MFWPRISLSAIGYKGILYLEKLGGFQLKKIKKNCLLRQVALLLEDHGEYLHVIIFFSEIQFLVINRQGVGLTNRATPFPAGSHYFNLNFHYGKYFIEMHVW